MMEKIKSLGLAFLSGALLVAIAFAIYLLKNVKPIVNAEQYVAHLEQKVGKIKQKGKGNDQVTDVVQELSKRELRKQKREARRRNRKAVLSDVDPESEI